MRMILDLLNHPVKLITFITVLVGAFLMHLVMMWLGGGRRGRLSTTRQQVFKSFHVDDVLREVERRLAGEGFQVQRGSDGQSIIANRKTKRPQGSTLRQYPFEKLKLAVEARVTPGPEGAIAQITATADDYVFQDTGEGEYLDVILDYLTMREKIRPMGPVSEFNAAFAMTCGIMALFVPALFFLPGMTGEAREDFFAGLMILAIFVVIEGIWGIVKVLNSQGRYKGVGQGITGLCLGLATALVGIAINVMFA